MSEYLISPDECSDFGIVMSGNDTKETATKAALQVLEAHSDMFDRWGLFEVIRDGDPELHDAVDTEGQHHLIPITKFVIDQEVGYIRIID